MTAILAIYIAIATPTLLASIGSYLWHRVTDWKRWLKMIGLCLISPIVYLAEAITSFVKQYLLEPSDA